MTFEFSSFSDGKEGAAKTANFFCSKYLKDSSLDGVDKEHLFTEPKMTEALKENEGSSGNISHTEHHSSKKGDELKSGEANNKR
ncbi:hypothetical protein GIB67_021639 [Kingdonia uniflora]|uniref:Uncharacterized protein n=1 Tax=Kingdonia uniflora TaxID=39325 RepID=A0A7J7KY66_9MAGN|nr:hypothetical protein GIB67_021639 [Kingdonia uniflora]